MTLSSDIFEAIWLGKLFINQGKVTEGILRSDGCSNHARSFVPSFVPFEGGWI